MSGNWSKVGTLTWYGRKAQEINDAYDLYQRTGSEDALADVAAKTGELLGIGIPLWLADKFFNKTGLDRVFDSLRKNTTYEDYLVRQAALKM